MCLLIKAKNHVHDASDSDSVTQYAIGMIPLSPSPTHAINKVPSNFPFKWVLSIVRKG